MEARLAAVMAGDERVLDDPAPAVYASGADASGVALTLYCWTENAAFVKTRSALWFEIVRLAQQDPAIGLAIPRQAVTLSDERAERS